MLANIHFDTLYKIRLSLRRICCLHFGLQDIYWGWIPLRFLDDLGTPGKRLLIANLKLTRWFDLFHIENCPLRRKVSGSCLNIRARFEHRSYCVRFQLSLWSLKAAFILYFWKFGRKWFSGVGVFLVAKRSSLLFEATLSAAGAIMTVDTL